VTARQKTQVSKLLLAVTVATLVAIHL